MVSMLCLLICLGTPQNQPNQTKADAILGVWITPEEKSRIEVYKTAEGYCGKIIDLKEKNYPADDNGGMAGKPKVDRENPETSLKNRPIIGLVLMNHFKFEDNQWVGGTIYDPESGKTYKCRIKLSDDGKKLDVRGYIGIPAFGRTSIWTKAP